ncbi:uncharacterized protein BDW43DRAFT_145719 [Aspergillus alliaceus]|uniref:uncharacterized protein n=1 Tax=Petromyces alliaceus TaxID=209559 RepID=UPI0012A4CAA8|nr:uncharacterized protein BDW43DRAFT_145719 [Aspergillus alliaceus]KAB8231087.1 hypothetical protein BDW43DRAFT_145719 [Aspergillus alliaceus]
MRLCVSCIVFLGPWLIVISPYPFDARSDPHVHNVLCIYASCRLHYLLFILSMPCHFQFVVFCVMGSLQCLPCVEQPINPHNRTQILMVRCGYRNHRGSTNRTLGFIEPGSAWPNRRRTGQVRYHLCTNGNQRIVRGPSRAGNLCFILIVPSPNLSAFEFSWSDLSETLSCPLSATLPRGVLVRITGQAYLGGLRRKNSTYGLEKSKGKRK